MKIIVGLLLFQLFLATTILANSLAVVADETRQSVTKRAAAIDACQQDYSPCTCYIDTISEPDKLFVSCNDVASFASVKAVFDRPNTDRQITSFTLTIPFSEANNTMPSNLLNETATKEIYLICPSGQISIDTNAFAASKSYAQLLQFTGCDLSRLDYSFLKDLQAMGELQYTNVINFSSSLASLPTLPSLSKITMSGSSDFQGFDQFPVSNVPAWSELSVISCPNFQYLPAVPPPLTTLLVNECPLFNQWDVVAQLSRLSSLTLTGFNEETINNALDTIVSSSLTDKITYFSFSGNGLTQVPTQIQSFTRLQTVYLRSNMISEANNGSLVFITPQLGLLELSSNNLNNIEPAAFQGDFSKSQIHLSYNNLKRFESSVFKPILEQMDNLGLYGGVYIQQNPIECDCHLSWLFKDNPKLVYWVKDGQCSNGTYFSWLSANDFASCSDDKVSTTTLSPTTTPSTSSGTSIKFFAPIVYLTSLYFILYFFEC